jgi:hypothetical protein
VAAARVGTAAAAVVQVVLCRTQSELPECLALLDTAAAVAAVEMRHSGLAMVHQAVAGVLGTLSFPQQPELQTPAAAAVAGLVAVGSELTAAVAAAA